MRPGGIGMVLDRALTPELLDVALRVATEHGDAEDARQLLSVALRDFVTPQEAANKTKKVLTHVWVVPPSPARAMIRWAVERQALFSDRSALHYGALLATFPFVGSIAAAVGRQLHIEGSVDPRSVKKFARATFGEREFIDAGAMKTLATMRRLNLLDGPKGGPYVVGSAPSVPPEFAGWFLHALILSRQAESVSLNDLSRAHEFAVVRIDPASSIYPLIEVHAEARGAVAVVRAITDDTASAGSRSVSEAQPQLDFGVINSPGGRPADGGCTRS